jgi:hypothetical protein
MRPRQIFNRRNPFRLHQMNTHQPITVYLSTRSRDLSQQQDSSPCRFIYAYSRPRSGRGYSEYKSTHRSKICMRISSAFRHVIQSWILMGSAETCVPFVGQHWLHSVTGCRPCTQSPSSPEASPDLDVFTFMRLVSEMRDSWPEGTSFGRGSWVGDSWRGVSRMSPWRRRRDLVDGRGGAPARVACAERALCRDFPSSLHWRRCQQWRRNRCRSAAWLDNINGQWHAHFDVWGL